MLRDIGIFLRNFSAKKRRRFGGVINGSKPCAVNLAFRDINVWRWCEGLYDRDGAIPHAERCVVGLWTLATPTLYLVPIVASEGQRRGIHRISFRRSNRRWEAQEPGALALVQ
jgi:hypothetical protein